MVEIMLTSRNECKLRDEKQAKRLMPEVYDQIKQLAQQGYGSGYIDLDITNDGRVKEVAPYIAHILREQGYSTDAKVNNYDMFVTWDSSETDENARSQ
jgi:hypothetical protein